jgi:hypothetical protein
LVTFDSDDNPLDNAELYDPLTRTFTVTGDMTTVPRGGAQRPCYRTERS